MRYLSICLLALIVSLASCSSSREAAKTARARVNTAPAATTAQKPIQMILDSDFGSSTDDLFALMMLHHYINDGRVDLKGIIVDREGEKNAGVVDIFNNYYGHPNIPVGLERNGVKNPRCFIPYNGICDMKDATGKPLFKRTLDTSKLPDGYKLYRQILSKAGDKEIVIVAIGFATTLSQLMESGADEYSKLSGVELLDKKVKAIYIQSGRFEAGDSLSGYNMRAASRQSAVFYSKLPASVDLIMSPSNVGDGMDYVPRDVLADLSTVEVNPIKSVYSFYTCDTGQRMWDTNCLVNAVLGDSEYILSPRGRVTFVDRGEESLMLFKQDAQGNARYQLPGDSYFNQNKLMDIRRLNRINPNPSPYTVEAPQPQLIGSAATAWVKPRLNQLVDKYMASAGNTLDPADVMMLLRPIGYIASNAADYSEATAVLEDAIYKRMLQRAVTMGKNSMVIVTGPPASGKSTAVRALKLGGAGLVYDADLSDARRLVDVINLAYTAGMSDVSVVMVYNDLVTCYKNAVNRGHTKWRFTPMDQLVAAYSSNTGNIDLLRAAYPDVAIRPINCAGNGGVRPVSLEEAAKWNYNVDEALMTALLNCAQEMIDNGELRGTDIPAALGDVLSIPQLTDATRPMAQRLDYKVREVQSQWR